MEEGGANVAMAATAAAAEEPWRICVMKSDTRSERDVRGASSRRSEVLPFLRDLPTD